MRILIVEDSEKLANAIANELEHGNCIVDIAHDGKSGFEQAATGIYDIAVLEYSLPGMSGIELLKKLRQNRNTLPVLILSSESEKEHKIEAFQEGADDYMTKPLDPRELLLRIRAILRRHGELEPDILSCEDFVLNLDTCQISNTQTNTAVKLAGKEFQLMEYLLRNQKQVITREQIINKIWGYDSDVEYNNVEVYISFLRKKLAQIDAHVRLKAVRGVGYILET